MVSVGRLGSFAQALIRTALPCVERLCLTSRWRFGSFAKAIVSSCLNVRDLGLAVWLRASAHPNCPALLGGARPGALLRLGGVAASSLAIPGIRASARVRAFRGRRALRGRGGCSSGGQAPVRRARRWTA